MNPDDPFWRMFSQQQALIRQAEAIRGAMYPLGLSPAMIDGLRQMQASYRATYVALKRPAEHVRQFEDTLKAARFLAAPRYLHEMQKWETLRRSALGVSAQDGLRQTAILAHSLEVQANFNSIASSLSARLPQFPALQTVLSAPTLDYSSFARKSLARADLGDLAKYKAVEASVILADAQVTQGNALIVSLIESENDDTTREVASGEALEDGAVEAIVAESPASPAASLFTFQQNELLAATGLGATDEYDQILKESPSAQHAQLAHTLCTSICELNQFRLLNGAREVFPPTTAMLMAASSLMYRQVRSKEDLGNAVDALYVLLYEGSGEATRILQWLSKDACRALWTLKQLRNVWLRHDPEHGTQVEQKKKWQQLREGLSFLGVSNLPSSTGEHHRLYSQLMVALNGLLGDLRTALYSRQA